MGERTQTHELLERESELERLGTLLAACRSEGGSLALVAGEAGIGKSALVRRFLELDARALRVLTGACEALFTPRPLGPLYDIAWSRAGELARLLETGAPRPALFAAALAELRGEPSVLVLEDVHWADEATLDFLKYLGRRIHATGALVLVTYRDDELGPGHPLHSVLGDLPRERVLRLVLAPLSPASVGALARAAGRADSDLEREDLHRITGGNPFFVSEVLAAVPASAAARGASGVPATVREAVLARTARLSAAGRAALEHAALFPGRVERALLAQLCASSAGIEECLGSGLLVGEARALAFRHELARRAIEATLEPGRRAEEHARVLAALEARAGADPARLAFHAGEAHDAPAVLRLAPVAAARAAAVGAHREAAAHYRSALAHADGIAPAARAELCEQRSYECYLTDAIPEALAARLDALSLWRELGDAEREGDCLRWASRLEWFLGRKAEADRHACEALARLEPLGPTRALAMACSNRAQLAMLEDDAPCALCWGERALVLALELGDLEVRVHALNNLGTTRWSSERERGRGELEQSLALAREHGLEEHVARAWTNLGARSVGARDYGAARAYLRDGIEYTSERDLDAWTLYMRAWLARLELECGRFDAAAREAEAVLARAQAAPISRIPALAVLGRLRARRGDPRAKEPLLEAHALARATGEAQRIVPVALARAEVAWLAGDGEACEAAAREGLACARLDPWARGELALWLARAGADPRTEPGAAGEHAEPFARELAGDARGAAQRWEELGCAYERALALAGGGEGEQRAALELLRALGAEPAARLVARRLREQGVRGIPRGERPATRANPAGLTARELEVLGLVDQGLRNADIGRRLFVSPKTVEHHVTSILAKLGVPSRARAAARARELGWLAPPDRDRGSRAPR